MANIPVQTTSPISWQTPIVNPDGTMTEPFRRLLQALTGNGSKSTDVVQQLVDAELQQGTGISILPDGHLLSNPTISADIQALLDSISATRGSLLYRGATEWDALAPGTLGQFLKTQGAGADPQWATVSGGGGATTLISRVTTSGSAASVSFGSLGSYNNLELVITGRASGSSTTVVAQCNGDTTSGNYRYQRVSGASATASAAQASAGGLVVGYLSNSSATANSASASRCLIPGYRDTVFFKETIANGGSKSGTADTNYSVDTSHSEWRSTAAITSLLVFPQLGDNFVDGTTLALYGIT